jgi:hypothetical protein
VLLDTNGQIRVARCRYYRYIYWTDAPCQSWISGYRNRIRIYYRRNNCICIWPHSIVSRILTVYVLLLFPICCPIVPGYSIHIPGTYTSLLLSYVTIRYNCLYKSWGFSSCYRYYIEPGNLSGRSGSFALSRIVTFCPREGLNAASRKA